MLENTAALPPRRKNPFLLKQIIPLSFPFPEKETTIKIYCGRRPNVPDTSNVWTLNTAAANIVSRDHFVLRVSQNGSVEVGDTNSTHGVFIFNSSDATYQKIPSNSQGAFKFVAVPGSDDSRVPRSFVIGKPTPPTAGGAPGDQQKHTTNTTAQESGPQQQDQPPAVGKSRGARRRRKARLKAQSNDNGSNGSNGSNGLKFRGRHLKFRGRHLKLDFCSNSTPVEFERNLI